MEDITYRRIPAHESHPLRERILRPYHRPEELVYPGDDEPETLHVGAFLEGELIGVAAVYRQPRAGEEDPFAWRIRGMATAEHVRGMGVGAALLHRCIAHAARNGGMYVWCNARQGAADFYRKYGFVEVSDVFDLPRIGPHYVMQRTVLPTDASLDEDQAA